MAELFNILTFVHSDLAAPLLIQETDGVVPVLNLSAPTISGGVYRLTLTFVSSYAALNDRLGFSISGTHTSKNFMKEAKDALESIPWGYSFLVDGNGLPIDMVFNAWVDGVGNADVTIDEASICVERVA